MSQIEVTSSVSSHEGQLSRYSQRLSMFQPGKSSNIRQSKINLMSSTTVNQLGGDSSYEVTGGSSRRRQTSQRSIVKPPFRTRRIIINTNNSLINYRKAEPPQNQSGSFQHVPLTSRGAEGTQYFADQSAILKRSVHRDLSRKSQNIDLYNKLSLKNRQTFQSQGLGKCVQKRSVQNSITSFGGKTA